MNLGIQAIIKMISCGCNHYVYIATFMFINNNITPGAIDLSPLTLYPFCTILHWAIHTLTHLCEPATRETALHIEHNSTTFPPQPGYVPIFYVFTKVNNEQSIS